MFPTADERAVELSRWLPGVFQEITTHTHADTHHTHIMSLIQIVASGKKFVPVSSGAADIGAAVSILIIHNL